MTSKIKAATNISEKSAKIAASLGLVLMSAAALTGIFEFQDHHRNRVVLPMRPVFAFAGQSIPGNNPLRREREEAGPHYISYSVTQRTPSRTGRR
jgi:hypothetical protein